MSIFLGDIRIRAAMQLGIEDVLKNPWLISDILGDTIGNEYLKKFYGKQIESCTQWLQNNRINVVMDQREDKVEHPSIIVRVGESDEKIDLKHMGDLSSEKVQLIPNFVNKPIPFVVKPAIGTYNAGNGIFTFRDTVDLTTTVKGQILVDPATGNGYVIQGVLTATTLQLLPNLVFTAQKYGVLPEYQYYETRVGHTFMKETYTIECNAMDQQTLLWLHSIAIYSLLRYRQPLLEADGFAESVISSSGMYENPKFSDGGQVIWSREIKIVGQVENRWWMQPHRVIEDVAFTKGLKILSNITDTFEDITKVNWSTLRDIAYADEPSD
jgi:hypothetical protein